jgi:hypothetical protein
LQAEGAKQAKEKAGARSKAGGRQGRKDSEEKIAGAKTLRKNCGRKEHSRWKKERGNKVRCGRPCEDKPSKVGGCRCMLKDRRTVTGLARASMDV